MVLTSWVRTIRFSEAAQARTKGSPTPLKPTSCARTRSRFGRRRSNARTMSLLRFSSASQRKDKVISVGEPAVDPADPPDSTVARYWPLRFGCSAVSVGDKHGFHLHGGESTRQPDRDLRATQTDTA